MTDSIKENKKEESNNLIDLIVVFGAITLYSIFSPAIALFIANILPTNDLGTIRAIPWALLVMIAILIQVIPSWVLIHYFTNSYFRYIYFIWILIVILAVDYKIEMGRLLVKSYWCAFYIKGREGDIICPTGIFWSSSGSESMTGSLVVLGIK